MNRLYKEVQIYAVFHGTYEDVQNVFYKHKLIFDDSYFDYDLLIAAFKRNNTEILKYLIYHLNCRVVNPNKIKLEETPLHLAMKLNNPSIVETLLSNGALPFDKDENGEMPILVGFKNRKYIAVRTLLKYCKFNCKLDDVDFMQHFHVACFRNYFDLVENCLKLGVNPNTPFNIVFKQYCGSSLNVVQYAAEKNYWMLFKLLVYYEGDLSVKNANGLTPLHIIYYNNSCIRIEIIKLIIIHIFEIGNNTKFVNAVDNNGVSHFHMCCMSNNPDFVQKFIDGGANVNSSTSLSCPINPGYTPLHFAVINGCEKVVELLLKNGADCNKQDQEGRTPLHLACNTSGPYKTYIVKLLLDYQTNPTIKDKRGYTPLYTEFYYADSDDQFIYDMLLSKISGEINYTNSEGLSYFHIACTTNKINIVKHFLDVGVNIDTPVSLGMYSGYTALHFAVLNNQKDVVELLLEKNAQINIKTNEFQVTPLHLACEFNYAKFWGQNTNKHIEKFEPFPLNVDSISHRRNQLDIISLLLSRGAEVDAKDYQGMTPLIHTCMIDRNYCKLNWSCTSFWRAEEDFEKEINIRIKEIIKLFLSFKAKVNACSNKKESILHIISKYSCLKIRKKFIKLILCRGIDIDAVDDDGLTPLHVAVQANNKRMVQILLEYNANVNVVCKNFGIPLHMLFSSGNPRKFKNGSDEIDIFCALLEKGSDVNMHVVKKMKKIHFYSRKGITLLCHAIEMLNDFIIGKLLDYGADVNIEDPSGNTCTSLLIDMEDYDWNHWRETESTPAFKAVYIHVQKLLALNLYVSKKVQNHCSELYAYQRAAVKLDNIFHDCTEELKKMKLIKINKNTSLNSILLIKDQHELAKYARNENLIKIIKAENFHEDFPLYGNILKAQFTRGSVKSNLLQSAKASLKCLFKVTLPDLCWDMVLKNLENQDCANLINVVKLSQMSLKKKSSDTNLKESEHLRNGYKKRKNDY